MSAFYKDYTLCRSFYALGLSFYVSLLYRIIAYRICNYTQAIKNTESICLNKRETHLQFCYSIPQKRLNLFKHNRSTMWSENKQIYFISRGQWRTINRNKRKRSHRGGEADNGKTAQEGTHESIWRRRSAGAEANQVNKPPSPPQTTGCAALHGSLEWLRTSVAGKFDRAMHTDAHAPANKLAATPRLQVSSDSLVCEAGVATVGVMQELELGVPATYPAPPSLLQQPPSLSALPFKMRPN
jgi:hypothetical protein